MKGPTPGGALTAPHPAGMGRMGVRRGHLGNLWSLASGSTVCHAGDMGSESGDGVSLPARYAAALTDEDAAGEDCCGAADSHR